MSSRRIKKKKIKVDYVTQDHKEISVLYIHIRVCVSTIYKLKLIYFDKLITGHEDPVKADRPAPGCVVG